METQGLAWTSTTAPCGLLRLISRRTPRLALRGLCCRYRIIPTEMRDLFLKFGPWENVVTNLTIIARSEIRNTASRYGGLEYLAGDRGLIAANMKVRER